MPISDHLTDLDAETYAEFGVDALWSGYPEPVRVRLSSPDEEQGVGRSKFIRQAVTIRVRASEVSNPSADDEVTIEGVTYRLMGVPVANRRRTQWLCQAHQVG